MNSHNPETNSAPVDGYSRASEVGPGARWPCISGTIPERPDGTIPSKFDAKCEAIWDDIEGVIASVGMSAAILIKGTTSLTDRAQAAPNREIRTCRLHGARPAMTVIVVQTLDAEWLLEIDAVAAE